MIERMLVKGFEMQIISLLRKMETKRGGRGLMLGVKRKLTSTSCFESELWKLEWLINYKLFLLEGLMRSYVGTVLGASTYWLMKLRILF